MPRSSRNLASLFSWINQQKNRYDGRDKEMMRPQIGWPRGMCLSEASGVRGVSVCYSIVSLCPLGATHARTTADSRTQ